MNNFKKRPVGEMPREKLLSSGAQSLSDAELLSILLQTGTKGKDVFALAIELLNMCGDISGIERIGIDEFLKVEGLNVAKITKLKAAVEIGRRVIYSNRITTQRVTNPKEAFTLLEPMLRGLSKESFIIILMNSSRNIIDIKKIGEGTVNAALIYPREVIELAIRTSASGIILAHNHPSGSITPSVEDKKFTMHMMVMGELSNTTLHDHIIIGAGEYFSFASEGILKTMKQQFTHIMAV